MENLPLSRAELEAAVARGERFDYLFFWGHRKRSDGRLGPACLSQWYPAEFELDGQRYASAEHFMMASKARLFGDEEALKRILQAESPDAAKGFGRKVRGFDERTWEEKRFELVVAGNVGKFAQNPALRRFLLETGRRVLVEASPLDRIWGIGLARDDPRAERPSAWCGLNLLGFALMVARQKLAAPLEE
jgi:ribA/ribD-fused uncharacterized protein